MKKIKKFFDSIRILPRRLFIHSPRYLVYVDITKTMRYILISFVGFSFFIGLLTGSLITSRNVKIVEVLPEIDVSTKYDYAVGDVEWKDSVFYDYTYRAHMYLSQPQFKGTPIKADMLSLAARNAYDSTGVILPVELALAQAQWESGMGKAGRSPEKNPFNVGEYDNGTVKYFKTTFEGIQAYYYLMCTEYLRCKSLSELFDNFTNCGGLRYASSPQYESKIKRKYYNIKHWIDNQMQIKVRYNIKSNK